MRINGYYILKIDLQKAHLDRKLFRFMEDLYAISDHLAFDKNYKDIYPSEPELKKESISTSEESFLVLSIIIVKAKLKTKLFD